MSLTNKKKCRCSYNNRNRSDDNIHNDNNNCDRGCAQSTYACNHRGKNGDKINQKTTVDDLGLDLTKIKRGALIRKS